MVFNVIRVVLEQDLLGIVGKVKVMVYLGLLVIHL